MIPPKTLVAALGVLVACDGERARPPEVAPSLEIPRLEDASTGAPTATAPGPASPAVRTSVAVGAPEVTGRYAAEDVTRVVRIVKEHEAELLACYNKIVAADRPLHGRVEVLLEIGKTGDVEAAIDHGSTIADQALVGCVRRVLMALELPKPPSGSVLVALPLDFDRAPAPVR